jgi:ribokinase
MKKDVIAIGSATQDVFLKTAFETEDYSETPSGKALRVPIGEKFKIPEAFFTLGGNAANAAVTFARQGFSTGIVSKVGHDGAGSEVLRVLQKEGVGTEHITFSDDLQTNYSVLLLQEGERTILSYHGAQDTFPETTIPFEELRSKWWYISFTGKSCKAFPSLMRFAEAEGIKVGFNPGMFHIKNFRQEIIDSLANVHFLVMNDLEAAELTGISFHDEEALFKELDRITPGIVAVTRGDKGATISDGTHIYQVEAMHVDTVVDSTGAGDAFGSGFVAGLIHTGEECKKEACDPGKIEYSIRLALANATEVIKRIGTTPGIITKDAFDASETYQSIEVQKRII